MEPWTRAIARITVGDYRGTGFLVSDTGLILTAFHVIANREKSLQQRRAVFHPAPIEVRFGGGNDATQDAGEAEVESNRYSIAEDWVLLRLKTWPITGPSSVGAPLQLARLTEPRDGRAFDCFGFPELEAELGGEYKGTLRTWSDNLIEAHVDNIGLGTEMGGISGAPCRVDGQIVAMILQSLADDRKAAVKASLYVRPIERAVRGCEGLVSWDDGSPMTFQDSVESYLPADSGALGRVGRKLGLPADRWSGRHVARRLLSSRLGAAAGALAHGNLSSGPARQILEHIGAMQLHVDACEVLREAGRRKRPALVSSARRLIQTWYLRRSHDPDRVSESKILAVRPRPGDEESGRSIEDWVALVEQQMRVKKLGTRLIAGMLSGEIKREFRFWLLLVGELRCDMIVALAERLPNATVLGCLNDSFTVAEQGSQQVEVIAPTMTIEEEDELLVQWECAAAELEIPLEPEMDA